MEQQKNFSATEPVEKLFRRLAFSAAVALMIMPADLYHPQHHANPQFMHFFPSNGCKPHK